MIHSILALFLLSMLSACGETHVHAWKPDTTELQAKQDAWACKQQSVRGRIVGVGGVMAGGAESDKELFKECMAAQGYEVWESDK